jgi:hypothetical protein
MALRVRSRIFPDPSRRFKETAPGIGDLRCCLARSPERPADIATLGQSGAQLLIVALAITSQEICLPVARAALLFAGGPFQQPLLVKCKRCYLATFPRTTAHFLLYGCDMPTDLPKN